MSIGRAGGFRAPHWLAIVGAVALVGVGTAVAGRFTGGSAPAGMTPLAVSSPAAQRGPVTPFPVRPPSPSTPTSWPPPVSAIPDGVMLASVDLGGADVKGWDPAFWRRGRTLMLRPCGSGDYPSGAERTAERSVVAGLEPTSRTPGPQSIVQYVAAYDRDGARRFMTDLRTSPAGCPGDCWISLGGIDAGDESELFQCSTFEGYAGEVPTDEFLAVVRVGRAVVLVGTRGTGQDRGDRSTARTLARTTASRMGPIA